MNTDEARRLITLHDNAERALANLRNAGAMSSDDPRATEMLESAGDAYADSLVALTEAQDAIIDSALPPAGAGVAVPGQPAPSAPGAEDSPAPAAQVQPEAERGTNAEARETIPVPKPEPPADAAS